MSDSLVDRLAKIEHDQWVHWTKNLVERRGDDLPDDLIERWEENWESYDSLDETVKESDRKWARRVIEELHEGTGDYEIPSFELMWSGDDSVVGIGRVDDDEIAHFDECVYTVEYLRKMIDLAEDMDWDRVQINVAEEEPLFIKHDDSQTRVVVAPVYLEDDEDE